MSMFDHAAGTITITGGTFNAFQANPATMDRMEWTMKDEERQKVMAWVSPIDVTAKHLDVSSTRHPGSGEWLLNSDTFQEWEHGTGRALWCHGMPGAGKTVLASLIIDHLRALQLRGPAGTIAVAWVYFNYKEKLTQTPDAIFLSLIRQLSVFSNELYDLLRSTYKKNPNSHPSARLLIPDMHTLTQGLDKIFIVIDALDESAENNQDAVLEVMAGLQKSGANILVTSRDHVYRITDSQLDDVRRIDIRGDANDITEYVNACVKQQIQLARVIRTDPSLHDEIVKAILDSCQGMFLMATLYMESLKKKLNARQVRKALRVLPTTFHGIYVEAMDRMESDSDYSQFALRALSFIIHARRPLTVVELQHFLAVEPNDTDINHDCITDKDILVSVCAGLVVIDDKTSIVRLVHFTAQEYFDNIRISKFPLCDQKMGHVCLTYLSFDAFKDIANLSNLLSRYALLKYIVHYWHMHIQALHHQEALRTLLSVFFKDDALLHAYSRFMEVYNPKYFGYQKQDEKILFYNQQHTALHAAAAAGLQAVVGWLIAADGAKVDSEDFMGKTALIYSSELGFTNIANLLITNGAGVNTPSRGGFHGTALQRASEGGHEAVVRLLLDNGAEINARGRHGGTALQSASWGGHAAIVRLLLDKGAEINMVSGSDSTALQSASEAGHEAVVRLLLDKGAEINAEGGYIGTALERASSGGHEAIVRLLLDKGAEINAKDGYGGTALQNASSCGHITLVRLLLDKGAEINAKGGYRGTALQRASGCGHEAVVRLLLDKGAEIKAEDKLYGTALQRASSGGREAVVRLLLDKGAKINAEGERYGTALQRASSGGHERVVRLLLDKGADINAPGGSDGTALQRASARGHEAVVKLLLDKGAEVNTDGVVEKSHYST